LKTRYPTTAAKPVDPSDLRAKPIATPTANSRGRLSKTALPACSSTCETGVLGGGTQAHRDVALTEALEEPGDREHRDRHHQGAPDALQDREEKRAAWLF
jgi:hypothetical protein